MSDIQVELKDGSIVDFNKFVVRVSNTHSEKFDEYEDAEKYLMQLDHERLKRFMCSKASVYFGNNKATIDVFVAWYANLDVFDKSEFSKLLFNIRMLDS